MEFDIDVVKSVLEKCEKECKGVEHLKISGKIEEGSEFSRFSYHCKLLINEGYIEAIDPDALRTLNSPLLPEQFFIAGLTWQGQDLLAAMRADNVWDKIKSNLGEMGVASLKEIPTLAINLALKMM